MMEDAAARLEGLLDAVVAYGASDLHLSVGRVPILRIDGVLTALKDVPQLGTDDVHALLRLLMSERAARQFEEGRREADFSYSHKEVHRFRVNAYVASGHVALALRAIPAEIRTLAELNLPQEIERFAYPSQGFALFTGPTGHGKTTTMASVVDIVNRTRVAHILTIEDPIEYVFREEKSLVHQREVGEDTASFAQALRVALREDPNVVVIGEMRDLESIATALTIAETGHLVFATLHTNDAAQTVDRIVDVFPAAQQQQIRQQLAATLSGIVSQRLLPKAGGGRVPAVELLVATPAVRNLIREGETAQIPGVIQTSAHAGMIPLSRSLRDLVERGLVSPEDASRYLPDALDLRDAEPSS